MPIVSIIDSETTGISKDSRLVEYAAVHLNLTEVGDEILYDTTHESFLINPGIEIPPEASAVHHLTLDHLASAISHEDAQQAIAVSLTNTDYVVAHNAAFDSRFIHTTIPWICTYRCAKHLVTANSYGNQALRYALGLKPTLPENLSSHRALYDSLVTVELFIYLLKQVKSLDELYRLTNTPILEKTLTFGQHRGKSFDAVPTGYLVWLQTLEDRSDDFKSTVKHHLEKRRGGLSVQA